MSRSTLSAPCPAQPSISQMAAPRTNEQDRDLCSADAGHDRRDRVVRPVLAGRRDRGAARQRRPALHSAFRMLRPAPATVIARCGRRLLRLGAHTDNQLLGNHERGHPQQVHHPPRFAPLDIFAMVGNLPGCCAASALKVTFANYEKPGENPNIGVLTSRMDRYSIQDCRGTTWSGCAANGRVRSCSKESFRLAEARETVAQGVEGAIVSNHGGGQLNGAPATADPLPLVGEAIEGEFPCFSTAALEPLAIGSRR
jgi:hypothetical protein